MKKTFIVLSVAALGVGLVFTGYTVYAATQSSPTPSFEVDTVLPYGPELVGSGFNIVPPQADPGQPIEFLAEVYDQSGVKSVFIDVIDSTSGVTVSSFQLLDDGMNDDGIADNDVFGKSWDTTGTAVGGYDVQLRMTDKLENLNTQYAGYLALGEGVCGSDSDCAAAERCCYGVCAVNECISDTDCDDGDEFTIDQCETVAVCPNYCSHSAVSCTDGDGLCPPNCDASNDDDCTDTTPPTVSILLPVEGEIIDGNDYSDYTVEVTAADPESDIAQVRFLLDGFEQSIWLGPPDPISGNYVWIMYLGTLSDGGHIIVAEAQNGIGTLNEDQVSFQYIAPASGNAPGVEIMDPVDGATVTGDTTVTVDAGDDGTITEVSFYHCVVGLMDSAVISPPAAGVSVILDSWNATDTATALLDDYVMPFAALQQDVKHIKLPLIPVAHAQAEITNCTTTTTTTNYTQCIYAMAIDNDNLVGTSEYVYVTTPITTTKTTCEENNMNGVI